MGTIYSVICNNCKHEFKKFSVGASGLSESEEDEESYSFPALDKKTNDIIAVNYFKHIPDENIVLYDSEGMYEPESAKRGYLFKDYIIHNGKPLIVSLECADFLCPKCNTYGINFEWNGMWD